MQTLLQFGFVTINYDYDPLYRLTEANYSTGDYYHYTYDAVGNRTEQQTLIGSVPLTNNYVYDAANRLTSVDGVAYTWDNNGNLLNDGANTYVYDSANRLTALSNQQSASSYQYSGLGDRLAQSVNGDTTNYTLDLNVGLTQVLNDGTNTYWYGVGRIAQVNTTTEYFLGDALNSTRQLTDASGQITLAQSYDPFGSVISSAGNGQSVYGYTSEQSDLSGLVYLRARYYSSGDGRFTSRDSWMGNYNRPLSLNRWGYVEGNPINSTDPSGHFGTGPWCWDNPISRANAAEKYVNRTALGYQIRDELNTYTAAGIGVQCYGTNFNASVLFSGWGPAQISYMETNTPYGQPIYEIDGLGNVVYEDGKPKIRDYGLRCYIFKGSDCVCGNIEGVLPEFNNIIDFYLNGNINLPPGYRLEDVHNQSDPTWAAEYMRRRIMLVANSCKGCKPTDIYIAAALAQNGPGFNYVEMSTMPNLLDEGLQQRYRIKKDWFAHFKRDLQNNNGINTKKQLDLFTEVIYQLRFRGWYLPSDVNFDTIEILRWRANQVIP